MTLYVELPAVAAADAVLLDTAVVEAAAAVGAPFEDGAGAALAVAEDDQVLAQDPRAVRRVGGELCRHGDGLPVPPQYLAHRRARADLGQPRVVRRCLAAVTGTGVHGARFSHVDLLDVEGVKSGLNVVTVAFRASRRAALR
nr:hypothetical protein [Kutzneria buriramensis]WKX07133.1 hypothetical protein Q4V64_06400 [Kutzneria buriramensis]